MPLTKDYLRYEPDGVFGLVGSNRGNVLWLNLRGSPDRYCAVPACENIIVWDLRSQDKLLVLPGDKHLVTLLASPTCETASSTCDQLAAGYADGTVRIFSLVTGECTLTFSGHKSAVTALNYDAQKMRLVSGAKDTEIVLWDLVDECGLFRLRGHKGVVTQARFCRERNFLVTSSMDTLVKFWDLDVQHCVYTIAAHRTEVWDFVLHDDRILITGSGDNMLRLWYIQFKDEELSGTIADQLEKKMKLEEDEDIANEESVVECKFLGSVLRAGKDRVVSLALDPQEKLLGCNGRGDKMVELFQVLSEDEVKHRYSRKEKKAKKRAREEGVEPGVVTVDAEDRLRKFVPVKLSHPIRSFQIKLFKGGANIISLLTNNALEGLTVPDLLNKRSEHTEQWRLDLSGHRTEVRTVTFSSDNTVICSASADSLKIWNRVSLRCIRTMGCPQALCCLFPSSDRYVIVGTKNGKILLCDIGSAAILEEFVGHEGEVRSLCLAPDGKSVLSGGVDQPSETTPKGEVKFWDLELIQDEAYSNVSRRLTLVHSRTLKMPEVVNAIKFSPDNQMLAIALLDNTVKILFADTLKAMRSLYGHSLPVTALDISFDSRLLITGSADKAVKIWGMDFGDCRRSLLAHKDSVMAVQFVPKSLLFFTAGKDGLVKQWDAESFQMIQILRGHHEAIWCMSVSPNGRYIVSASHDKSLRLWNQTDGLLVLDDEREMEREADEEKEILNAPVIAGEKNKETGLAANQTMETIKGAERLIEALMLYQELTAAQLQHDMECKGSGKQVMPLPLHPMLKARSTPTPEQYVLDVLKKVKASELELALLTLPFAHVTELLVLLAKFAEKGWQLELVAKTTFFLLRVHQGEIVSSKTLLPVIDRLRRHLGGQLRDMKDVMGTNLAGLQTLQYQLEQRQVVLFADATGRLQEKTRKRRKREQMAALLSLTKNS